MNGTTAFCGFGASVDYWNAEALSGDREMLLAIKEDMHNLLYALANSAALNGVNETTHTEEVQTWWRTLYKAGTWGFGILAVLSCGCAVISKCYKPKKKEAK